jgi:hypothetical protein
MESNEHYKPPSTSPLFVKKQTGKWPNTLQGPAMTQWGMVSEIKMLEGAD